MRIFLTGATGYLGAAVLDALLRGGVALAALGADVGGRDAERLRLVLSGERERGLGSMMKP